MSFLHSTGTIYNRVIQGDRGRNEKGKKHFI